ncbi:MAG: AAA family ATPase [Myxococcales bacterium]|nr:AAA family ATPase [Myxococcales bacterium]
MVGETLPRSSNGKQLCRIALTGGPGGGKTTAADMLRREIGDRIVIVPESATMLFSGGFPRCEEASAREAVQQAIFHVQRNLEEVQSQRYPDRMLLCDRGTVDGAAYWPEPNTDAFFEEVGSSCAEELARYHAVIILDVPTAAQGYDHRNPTRIETPDEASRIGHRIQEAWRDHPRCTRVGAAPSFWSKIQRSVDLIGQALDG